MFGVDEPISVRLSMVKLLLHTRALVTMIDVRCYEFVAKFICLPSLSRTLVTSYFIICLCVF